MDLFMNDLPEILEQKILGKRRFATYEALKGAVHEYSAKIGYGCKVGRADGNASARSTTEPEVFWGAKKSSLSHCCDELQHFGQVFQADTYALSWVLASQLQSQGSLPEASSIVTIAAKTLDMPVKKATELLYIEPELQTN